MPMAASYSAPDHAIATIHVTVPGEKQLKRRVQIEPDAEPR
jgi:hypothetical protein